VFAPSPSNPYSAMCAAVYATKEVRGSAWNNAMGSR
jgi:hypothetical protein